jgi:hypothetical protein
LVPVRVTFSVTSSDQPLSLRHAPVPGLSPGAL